MQRYHGKAVNYSWKMAALKLTLKIAAIVLLAVLIAYSFANAI